MIPVPGVYMIQHKPTGRAYVGSSRNVEARCKDHVWQLNAGSHPVTALQADWKQYGASTFWVTLLEPLDFDGSRLDAAERAWAARIASAGYALYSAHLAGRKDSWHAPVHVIHLRRRRLERGWSLVDLSRESGLSARTLSLLERGVREPRPATIALLARVIECEPRDLMEPEA